MYLVAVWCLGLVLGTTELPVLCASCILQGHRYGSQVGDKIQVKPNALSDCTWDSQLLISNWSTQKMLCLNSYDQNK